MFLKLCSDLISLGKKINKITSGYCLLIKKVTIKTLQRVKNKI